MSDNYYFERIHCLRKKAATSPFPDWMRQQCDQIDVLLSLINDEKSRQHVFLHWKTQFYVELEAKWEERDRKDMQRCERAIKRSALLIKSTDRLLKKKGGSKRCSRLR